MDYQVIWLDEAIDDLGRAVRYIAGFNPTAARKTGETILAKVRGLGRFPRLGKIYAKLARDDVREIPVPPYRVIYRLNEGKRTIHILTVWHGARREPANLPGS